MARFLVYVERVLPDGCIVAANCSECDVLFGTVFTSLVLKHYPDIAADASKNWGQEWTEEHLGTIRLSLDSAEKFNNQLNCLPQAWSAGVRLSGLEADMERLAKSVPSLRGSMLWMEGE
jgi:hypothetical protein